MRTNYHCGILNRTLVIRYIEENISKFTKVYDFLEDKKSKNTFIGVCNTRLTGNIEFLKEIYEKNEYFDKSIVKLTEEEVFVDGGAYNGDTLELFMKATNKQYKKYYAFEPDEDNLNELKSLIELQQFKNVIPMKRGIYSESKEICFSGKKGLSSFIDRNGDGVIKVEKIDEVCSDATFIKMDIEGAELEALRGAENTIIKNKPKLAICIYHKIEHLTDIILHIDSLRKDYKYYVRQHSKNSSDELVLYAV